MLFRSSGYIANKTSNPNDGTIVLNELQIIKRKRNLNIMEMERIRRVIENNPGDVITLTGAYILLGMDNEASREYTKLSKDEQSRFDGFPINRFWNIKRG